MEEIVTVDARYKSCPGPLLSLVKAVREVKPGTKIKLLATDPAAPSDIKAWTENVGHQFLDYKKINETYEIYIKLI